MAAARPFPPDACWSPPSARVPAACPWAVAAVAASLVVAAAYGVFSAAQGVAWDGCLLRAAIGMANGLVFLLPAAAYLRRIPALR